jgi:hypothetical protein
MQGAELGIMRTGIVLEFAPAIRFRRHKSDASSFILNILPANHCGSIFCTDPVDMPPATERKQGS